LGGWARVNPIDRLVVLDHTVSLASNTLYRPLIVGQQLYFLGHLGVLPLETSDVLPENINSPSLIPEFGDPTVS
jgi:hypothetical protein